ncbi:PREDICTED: uncharacterized protein LOC107337478 [Acropora digitifera]|uniref:uncharacterized protein LOC107337478 n=1 Tax=Acropora digitifera TaxID=70779 RepID=UPI00077A0D19|nr:PREDICTED: uncharacterized protein LOC107337478 [Acropora digitifera]XP_015758125.1 PREDICTED: uncharacterized protein LOC107337478 [Acropora digitifera]XP_015758126.1 PREDICTED: uncharacterized protein LOC107337478 [Acropora digitifera]
MDVTKDPEPKVQFSEKANDSLKKPCRRKTKIIALGGITLVLLLGAVVSVSVYFLLKKNYAPHAENLVEVDLEEGETLTYLVDHNIHVQGGGVQKAVITVTVRFRVLNKTSEEYWFLTKFNFSHVQVEGNMEIGRITSLTEYFLVRLLTHSRKTTFPFEVHGDRHTNTELIRLVYGILVQLIPSVKRDLYESVDGQKAHLLDTEESPLLPGSVKMHREANTTDKDRVTIKNHFDRTDFDDKLSDIDLDLKYSDTALINKSNGMVSESHVHFYKRLNFGEPVDNGGFKATNMQVTVESHASLIESNFLGYEESKTVDSHSFVKLVILNSNFIFSVVNNTERPTEVEPNAVSNSSSVPFGTSSPSQHLNFTSNFSGTPLKRSRRAANVVPWNEAGRLSLNTERSFKLFEKKVIGIDIKGVGKTWLKNGRPAEIGVGFHLFIGRKRVHVFTKQYDGNQLKDGKDQRIEHRYSLSGITIQVPVFILSLGVDFSLVGALGVQLNFPSERNSVSPVKLAVEIEPTAEVTVSIDAHVSAYIIRAGVYGDGTLARVGLPVALSYQATRSSGEKWCLDLSVRLTALELRAGIFYQRRGWWFRWGTRHTLYEFGRWAAINKNWQQLAICG